MCRWTRSTSKPRPLKKWDRWAKVWPWRPVRSFCWWEFCDPNRAPPFTQTPGPGLHHAAQPRGHGLDAHRAGRPLLQLPQAGRVLPRAGARWRRADGDRRYLAQPAGLVVALWRHAELHIRRVEPPQGDHRGTRGGRQDIDADPALLVYRGGHLAVV